LATTSVFDAGTIGALQRNLAPVPALLQAMSRAFWDFVQTRRLLSGIPGLSLRQVEALRFAARGFTVGETADQMAVSRRSAEGIFAEARRRLGAPTTASALYRAMVYRSLT
jgi:DNA-binding CsgD family transcriptional regulator